MAQRAFRSLFRSFLRSIDCAPICDLRDYLFIYAVVVVVVAVAVVVVVGGDGGGGVVGVLEAATTHERSELLVYDRT